MKKTLVALAALAASAAFAQSTVTLSGVIDAGVESIADTPVTMAFGRSSTSNITVAGVEDLGGGLKAKFQVSSAFDNSTSTVSTVAANPTNGQFGNNGMFVGIESASMGSLIMGRMANTLYTHQQIANGTKGVNGFAATNTLYTGNDSVYVGNAIQYATPTMAGFTAQLEIQAAEVAGAQHGSALGLKYANGPITATLVRADFNNSTNGAASSTVATVSPKAAYTVNQLGASYDFGVAKVLFTYQDINEPNAATDPNAKSMVLGLTAPVGPGMLWASYGRATRDGAASDANILGLGYKYSLSKRSIIYVNAGSRSDARVAYSASAGTTISSATTTGSTGYGIGIQHNF